MSSNVVSTNPERHVCMPNRVAEYLRSKEPDDGVPHQELNSWCECSVQFLVDDRLNINYACNFCCMMDSHWIGIEEVVKAMSDGKLSYRRVEHGTLESASDSVDGDTTSPDAQTSELRTDVDDRNQWGAIEQVVGKAGDIVLLHPWCVHSGTTNFGTRPRLMLNGMARMKQDTGDVDEIPSDVSSRLIKDTLVSLVRPMCGASKPQSKTSLDD
eukprot:COSAG02_NODE_2516_length_8621_cov_3.609951_1_plen_213_part_00